MNLPSLAVKRPVFVTCILLSLIVVGLFSFFSIPVDLFPDVTFPVVTVTTPYPGAGPKEIETLVSKPLEEELGTISGVKTIRSTNREGVSQVVIEFTLKTDVKYAEQQVRDKVSSARPRLPDDIKEPTIRRIDPSDMPILILTLKADLSPAKMYDLANEVIKPKLEQVPQVGLVDILGARKREIHVDLDRKKLARSDLSVTSVAQSLASAGENIPAGSVSRPTSGIDMVFRTVGEFDSVQAIRNATVSFFGNDRSITLSNLGQVTDSLVDPTSYTYWNGQSTVLLYVFKQSGANTVQVADAVLARINKINQEVQATYGKAHPVLTMVSNQARFISLNVSDVQESIFFGILLTVLVVYFFLGNWRSTLITGVAIPVSLIGAFALMYVAGFSLNVMSLLAFSLAVGLLIDDAIVVRENIFRHMEMGKGPKQAALEGTLEVTLAVVAVTMTILAVFMPIGFLSGVVGQFFKQFGLTVCFIMSISLFDALTNAPMMSAYFGGRHGPEPQHGWRYIVRTPVRLFDQAQDLLQEYYARFLRVVVRRPWVALVITFLVVLTSLVPLMKVPKTFLPEQDSGEFSIGLEMPPGTSLESMRDHALKIDELLRHNPDVVNSVLTVGNEQGEKNKAEFYVFLKPFGIRTMSTSDFKSLMRKELKAFSDMNPTVKDIDYMGAGMRPFTLDIIGQDLDQVEQVAGKLFERLKHHPALVDVDTSYRPGKPEFQAVVDLKKAEKLGVTSAGVGRELRAQVEGLTPAKFRQDGLEYDIRVRLQPDQRDLQKNFASTLVPNINQRLVRLSQVASPVATTGPASIDREDRGRYIQISADLAAHGPGMGKVIQDINDWLGPKGDIHLPAGVTYRFVGQAEDFQNLMINMALAALLGLVFIYLVLSSLYESFFTPFTIMLVIPLAACGAFFALYIAGKSLDLFSIIGCIMLMGLATKNSIILVDYINQLLERGMGRAEAIVEAGRVRLRPILMTSFALIAGMIPIAIGLNEVSNQRTSLGVAVIGGVVSSTLLTLIVIPAAFSYIETFRLFMIRALGRRLVTVEASEDQGLANSGKYSHPDSFASTPDGTSQRNKMV